MFCKMNRVTVEKILAEFTVTVPLVSAEHKSTAALAPKTSFVIDTLMLTAMSIICTLIDVCKNKKMASEKTDLQYKLSTLLNYYKYMSKSGLINFCLVMISCVLKYGTVLLDLLEVFYSISKLLNDPITLRGTWGWDSVHYGIVLETLSLLSLATITTLRWKLGQNRRFGRGTHRPFPSKYVENTF